jgi:hypothetical protein
MRLRERRNCSFSTDVTVHLWKSMLVFVSNAFFKRKFLVTTWSPTANVARASGVGRKNIRYFSYFYGGRTRAQTLDPLIKSQLLIQRSERAMVMRCSLAPWPPFWGVAMKLH